MTEDEFPVADISEGSKSWWTGLSKMWLATIACLLIAVALTAHALESPGPMIVIHFSEGHGLKPHDALRHRGIDIGQVESVQLNEELDGVEVRVVLDTSAEAIACEGSRFWIVRPELDFTGISGLETAVGAKYLAVIPGGSKTKQTEFEGLSKRPADTLGRESIEIILRGDDRYGVNPGSPLTWRGVEVGQVLSSSLTGDAMHVDTRVQILAPYQRLLSRNSKFWVTSGVHMGLNVTGFELDTESFATIARGGIAFITPGPVDSTDTVEPGDVFKLHEERDDHWIDNTTALNLTELEPPPLASIVASWKQKYFGITRSYKLQSTALTVATQSEFMALAPASIVTPPIDAIEDTFAIEYRWEALTSELEPASEAEKPALIKALPVSHAGLNFASVVTADRIRALRQPEECFAVRQSRSSENESAVVIEMIGKHQLTADLDAWKTSNTNLHSEIWQGAPVIASEDAKVIGMLVVTDEGALIAPLPLAPGAL